MENFPIIIRIFILAVWMLAVPVVAGNCLPGMEEAEVGRGWKKLPFLWISGQMLLWAGFQIISVPLILREKNFHLVVILFCCYIAILVLCGVAIWLRNRAMPGRLRVAEAKAPGNKRIKICWMIFAVLLLTQLALAVVLAYADGDDAYYVAVSNITTNADTMYRKLPYTGGSTEIDTRHGMAPFPVWISFLSWGSGIKAAAVAHTVVPLMLIPMTYGIFYLLGKKLFPQKGEFLPLFLVLTELQVLFGDYSFYTVEHFMIARSRQGKAALGSIVIPLLFWLLFVLYEHLQQGKKCGISYWLLFLGTTVTGSLCTTLGAILVCMLIGIAGLCGAVCYRKWSVLLPLGLCCLPCVVYALLYIKL